MHTITTTPTQEIGLTRAAAAYNANLPEEAQLTNEQYLQFVLNPVLDSYVAQYAQPNISRTEFLRRIPADKRIAIRQAATQSAALADYLALLDATPEVNLTDLDTIGGIHALVAAGLLTQADADVILAL